MWKIDEAHHEIKPSKELPDRKLSGWQQSMPDTFYICRQSCTLKSHFLLLTTIFQNLLFTTEGKRKDNL